MKYCIQAKQMKAIMKAPCDETAYLPPPLVPDLPSSVSPVQTVMVTQKNIGFSEGGMTLT